MAMVVSRTRIGVFMSPPAFIPEYRYVLRIMHSSSRLNRYMIPSNPETIYVNEHSKKALAYALFQVIAEDIIRKMSTNVNTMGHPCNLGIVHRHSQNLSTSIFHEILYNEYV